MLYIYCEKQTGSRVFNQSLLFILFRTKILLLYDFNIRYARTWQWHVNERSSLNAQRTQFIQQHVIYLDFRLWIMILLLRVLFRLSPEYTFLTSSRRSHLIYISLLPYLSFCFECFRFQRLRLLHLFRLWKCGACRHLNNTFRNGRHNRARPMRSHTNARTRVRCWWRQK